MEAGHLMTLAYLIPIPGTMLYELPVILPENQAKEIAGHACPTQRPAWSSDIASGQTNQHKREYQQDQREHSLSLG